MIRLAVLLLAVLASGVSEGGLSVCSDEGCDNENIEELSLLQTSVRVGQKRLGQSSSRTLQTQQIEQKADALPGQPVTPMKDVLSHAEKPENKGFSFGVVWIMVLVLQFLLIYTFWALLNTWNLLRWGTLYKELKESSVIAESLMVSANMVPMECILIIVAQVKGEEATRQVQPPSRYGLPPWWVTIAIAIMVCSGLLAMLMQLISLLAGDNFCSRVFRRTHSIATFMQYFGITVVVVGVLYMTEPFDMWLQYGRNSTVSDSLASMTALVIMFFCIYGILHLSSGIHEFGSLEKQQEGGILSKVARNGAVGQNLSPMLCVLIMAARLRNYELTEQSNVSSVFFYVAVCATLVHSLVAMFTTVVDEARSTKASTEIFDEQSLLGNPTRRSPLMDSLEGFTLLVVLAAAVGVVVDIMLLDHSEKGTSVKWNVVHLCVFGLGLEHLATNIFLFLMKMCLHMRGAGAAEVDVRQRIAGSLRVMRETTRICVVVAALLLAVRMHTLRFNLQAQPKTELFIWAQFAMWALLAKLLVSAAVILGEVFCSKYESGGQEAKPLLSSRLMALAHFVCFGLVWTAAIGSIYCMAA